MGVEGCYWSRFCSEFQLVIAWCKVNFTENLCAIKIWGEFFDSRHLMSFTNYCLICLSHNYCTQTRTDSESFFGTTTMGDTHGVGSPWTFPMMSSSKSLSISCSTLSLRWKGTRRGFLASGFTDWSMWIFTCVSFSLPMPWKGSDIC